MSDTMNIDCIALARQVLEEIKSSSSEYKNLSEANKAVYEKAVNDLSALSVKLASAKPEEAESVKKEIEIVKLTIMSISAISEMFLFRKTINIIGGILGTAGKAALAALL